MVQPSELRRADARVRAVQGDGGAVGDGDEDRAGGGVMSIMAWPADLRASMEMERARWQAGEGSTTPAVNMLVRRALVFGQ